MSAAAAPKPLAPPWLALVGLVLLAHAALLSAWTPPARPPADAGSSLRYWSTRSVAAPVLTRPAQAPAPAVTPAPAPAPAAPTVDRPPRAASAAAVASARVNAGRSTRQAGAMRLGTPGRTTRPAPATARARQAVAAAHALNTDAIDTNAVDPNAFDTDASHAHASDAQAFESPSQGDRSTASRAAGNLPAAGHMPLVRLAQAATLHYAVTGSSRGVSYQARSQLRWEPDAGRYEAQWLTQGDTPSKQRRWHSQGLVTATGLMPQRFAQSARGERAAHFDAEGGRVRFSANTPDAVWTPGAQDRLSAMLQLGALLASAPERYPPGTGLSMQTAGARDALPWQWTVHEDETLVLDGQAVVCAVLVHAPERPYEPRTTLWLARALDYLPARVRTSSAQGDVVEHNLQNFASTR